MFETVENRTGYAFAYGKNNCGKTYSILEFIKGDILNNRVVTAHINKGMNP